MQVRLGFAVAAHLESEILLVDEVLAVGDMEFQRRCLGKMDEVASGGRTILFVSHQLPMIASLCDRALLLAFQAGEKRVDRSLVDRAAADVFGRAIQGTVPLSRLNWGRWLGAGAAADRKSTRLNSSH